MMATKWVEVLIGGVPESHGVTVDWAGGGHHRAQLTHEGKWLCHWA